MTKKEELRQKKRNHDKKTGITTKKRTHRAG